MPPMQRVTFLDTPLDLITQQVALKYLQQHDRHCSFAYVVTPNVDHVLRCHGSAAVAKRYQQACLSLCDSRILAAGAFMKGLAIPEVITGSGLTRMLFEQVLTPQHRITIIGGSDDMVARLKARYTLDKVFHHNPPMGFIYDEQAIEACGQFVASHKSDLILLAVGSPQQEALAARLQTRADCRGLGLCIGASLLFLTGFERRAPSWISRIGMEWFYRLCQNPRRLWRRYWGNLRFLPLLWQSPRVTKDSIEEKY